MITLVVLALLFIAQVSSIDQADETKEEAAFDKEVVESEKLSEPTTNLMQGLDKLLMKFNCDIDDDSCTAWRAARLIQEADLKEKLQKPGPLAKKLLGRFGKLRGTKVMKVLGQEMNTIFDKKHGPELQALSKALSDYICFKVPTECEVTKKALKSMHQWEKDDGDSE